MREQVLVRVGRSDADLVGADHRVLQAAVDYVANLGGGVVEIGPGVFHMENSLHLRGHVQVRGRGETTVLRKCAAAVSTLILDGDYGEEQITVADPADFRVGMAVTVCDNHSDGFDYTVRSIVAAKGSTLEMDGPLFANCLVSRNARALTTFPVVSGYYVEGVRVENLAIDGNKGANPYLNGCRGAGIFLYRAHGAQVVNCVVRDYNGDGISYQQSDDVLVEGCHCLGNTYKGLHPGSGCQRPTVRNCELKGNGGEGLFLCWRVRRGVFEGNVITGSGRAGISIGHKDTDNLFRNNTIAGNALYGVHFRKESEPMAGHRNRFEGNRVQDNGGAEGGYGVYVDGETHDITLIGNTIGDTRPQAARRQRVGVYAGSGARRITLQSNDLAGNAEHPTLAEVEGSIIEG